MKNILNNVISWYFSLQTLHLPRTLNTMELNALFFNISYKHEEIILLDKWKFWWLKYQEVTLNIFFIYKKNIWNIQIRVTFQHSPQHHLSFWTTAVTQQHCRNLEEKILSRQSLEFSAGLHRLQPPCDVQYIALITCKSSRPSPTSFCHPICQEKPRKSLEYLSLLSSLLCPLAQWPPDQIWLPALF